MGVVRSLCPALPPAAVAEPLLCYLNFMWRFLDGIITTGSRLPRSKQRRNPDSLVLDAPQHHM